MCDCNPTHACRWHADRPRLIRCGDTFTLTAPVVETPLERAERRYHEALNVSGSTARTLDAADTYIHELKMALHGSVAA